MGATGSNVLSSSGQNVMGMTAASKTIGSIRNRQINFSQEHKFFNSNVHTRPQARAVRAEVQDDIDRDVLGKKPQKWNSSV